MTNNSAGVSGNTRKARSPGFTLTYGVKRLVWYGVFDTALEAISFEKQLKRWRRAWKLSLIERENPQWFDLYDTL